MTKFKVGDRAIYNRNDVTSTRSIHAFEWYYNKPVVLSESDSDYEFEVTFDDGFTWYANSDELLPDKNRNILEIINNL